MANRYSKLPRRTYSHMVRLTEAEERVTQWLRRALATDGHELTASDVLRLVLSPKVVSTLIPKLNVSAHTNDAQLPGLPAAPLNEPSSGE